jgi:hypothetical protein
MSNTSLSKRLCRSIWFAGFTAAAGTAGLHSCADQPKPHCTTFPASAGTYAMRLVPMGEEDETAPGVCDALETGYNGNPEVGINPYFEKGSDQQPDYSRGSIGIQTAELGTLLSRAESSDVTDTAGGKPYALGKFTTGEPDDEGFCRVPELSTVHLVLDTAPAIPDDPETEEEDGVPEQPAVDIELRWSSVELYVSPALLGTQFTAELTDIRTDAAGESCTRRFRVLGLAPAVPCFAVDGEGAPVMDDEGNLTADESQCSPLPPPDQDRALGSGISVGVAYRCDPDSFYCVLSKDTLPSVE